MIDHILQTHLIVPAEIVRADGLHLFDRDGKVYVDFEAGLWCMALGYGHPRIQARMTEQVGRVMHLGPLFTNRLTEQAAQALVRHSAHPDGKALFLSSGSEAVELMIHLARLVTGRRELLAVKGSYLGAYGVAAQGSETGWKQVDLSPCQTCARCECAADCPVLREIHPEQFAAFVLEPVLASGGIRMVPSRPVRFLAAAVQAAGGLAAVDEVTTGMGRTGTWWGFEQHGVIPDLFACGKGLGNGYPVSAVVMAPAVAEAVGRRDFRYAQSHQNDPLAAAIAAEVLAVLDEGLLEQSAAASRALERELRGLQARHRQVVDVRGVGLLWGMELQPGIVETVWERMFRRGYMIGIKAGQSLLRFLPPLTMAPAVIAEMATALGDELERTEG